MEKAHRDRLDSRRDDLPGDLLRLLVVEGKAHPASGVEALVDLEGEVPGHDRLRALEEEVVGLGSVPAPDVVVSRPPRHHERRGGALALDDGVDGDGRAVHEARHPRKRTPLFSRQLRIPSERSSGVVALLAPKSRPSSSS
jgi:hypothetical protein